MKWLNDVLDWLESIYHYYDNLEYENLNIQNPENISLIIIGLYIGMVIACFMFLYSKRYLAGFVNRLLDAGATSPEKALTVKEAGYSKHAFLYNSLTDGKVVRKTVLAVPEDEGDDTDETKERKTNPRTARFYIPEERSLGARIRYNMKNSNIWVALGAVVALGVLSALVFLILPDLIRMVDNLITIIKKG